MESTKDLPGCARVESKADPSPVFRLRARRAVAAVCALAAAAGFSALAAGGAATPQPEVARSVRLVETGSSVTVSRGSTVTVSRSGGPMIAARSRRARLGIGLFTATPSHLPATGGHVKLTAVVQHASSCTFTFARGLGRAPASKRCGSGEATASVTLPRNTSSSDRAFRFEVRVDGGGSSVSAAPVTVIEAAASRRAAPKITLEPANATVSAGAAISFTAAAHGAPSPTVRWQVSSDGGRTWTVVAGAKSATYAFTAVPGQSGSRYRAVFTNANGSATSAPAVLTVQPQVVPVSIGANPASVSVTEGMGASFSASASGLPVPNVQWQLSTDGGASWSDVAGATSTSYAIGAAALAQSGDEFRAVFTNEAGPAPTAAATLTVVAVPQAPQVTTQPISQIVLVNRPVTFIAAASGSPSPTVQWQLSTDNGSTFNDISGANASTYSTVASDSDDEDQYRAVFTNAAGTATSNAATLTVPASAPQITQQPANRAVVAGNAASFTAGAVGTPAPSVKWQVSMDNGASWGDVSGATSATYSFMADPGESGDQYRAVFANGSGTATSSPASLVVGNDTPSVNWSGYGANQTGVTYTMVTGSWTVPTVNCSSADTYSSTWVGIDGDFTTPTVEQDGTESDCIGGTPFYDAWWEFYPASSQPLVNSVSPGDSMTASVSVSAGTWTLALADNTAGWSVAEHPTATQTVDEGSVEWIVERPEVCTTPGNCPISNLANFGTTAITGASATANGVTSSISGIGATALEMVGRQAQNPDLLALPGALGGGGTSFGVTWYAGF